MTTALATAILAQNPIAYWKLDETSGVVVADSSGNGRDGTIGGTGVTLGATVGAYVLPTFATGITGHVNVYSAGLSGAFSGDEGAAVLLVRPANITAGTRHLLYLTSPFGMIIRVTQVGATLIVRREDTGGTAQTLQAGALAAGVLTFIGVKWSVANNSLSGVVGAAAIGAGASGLVTWADTLSAALISGVIPTGTTARIAGNIGQLALFNTPNVDFAAIYDASGLGPKILTVPLLPNSSNLFVPSLQQSIVAPLLTSNVVLYTPTLQQYVYFAAIKQDVATISIKHTDSGVL